MFFSFGEKNQRILLNQALAAAKRGSSTPWELDDCRPLRYVKALRVNMIDELDSVELRVFYIGQPFIATIALLMNLQKLWYTNWIETLFPEYLP